MKIDVEGFEPEVLAGAERVLAKRPAVLLEAEERHRPGVCAQVAEILAGYGLEGLFVADGRVRPFAEFDPAVNQPLRGGELGAKLPGYATNFLFFPNEDRAAWEQRLTRAAAG